MAYSVWDYDAAEWVAHGQSFPRPGMIEAVRVDPTNLVSNCPPDLKGSSGERYGWFREVEVVEAIGADQKSGLPQYASFPDFDGGAVTKTIPAIDLTAEERMARDVALLKQKRDAINSERNRRVFLPVGPVDVRGDGTLMVEPDVRDDRDRSNLGDLHSKALSLKDKGVTIAVIPFGAADNVEYTLTPLEMLTVAEAPLDRASLLFSKAHHLKNIIETSTAEELIDFDASDDIHWL